MNEKIKALKYAFPPTIPILAGFIVLGMAFGMLMRDKGFGLGLTFLMSAFIYAGAVQFMAVPFLLDFNPLLAFIFTIMINARYIFYGVSMLTKYHGTGKFKPYLIFGMVDETFSLLWSSNPPQDVNRNWYMFFVTILNHLYWVLGSVIGSVAGSLLKFNTKGLDFILTALFVVIFLNQWRNNKNHKPALIGIGSSVLCLLISRMVFHTSNFLVPAMILIFTIIIVFKDKLKGAVE